MDLRIVRQTVPDRHDHRINHQFARHRMYDWVGARFYFLLSLVDGGSYIVHHKLLMSLDGVHVATELQAALETANGAQPRVVHDHGSEFVYRDVAAVIRTHNLLEIKTRRCLVLDGESFRAPKLAPTRPREVANGSKIDQA